MVASVFKLVFPSPRLRTGNIPTASSPSPLKPSPIPPTPKINTTLLSNYHTLHMKVTRESPKNETKPEWYRLRPAGSTNHPVIPLSAPHVSGPSSECMIASPLGLLLRKVTIERGKNRGWSIFNLPLTPPLLVPKGLALTVAHSRTRGFTIIPRRGPQRWVLQHGANITSPSGISYFLPGPGA